MNQNKLAISPKWMAIYTTRFVCGWIRIISNISFVRTAPQKHYTNPYKEKNYSCNSFFHVYFYTIYLLFNILRPLNYILHPLSPTLFLKELVGKKAYQDPRYYATFPCRLGTLELDYYCASSYTPSTRKNTHDYSQVFLLWLKTAKWFPKTILLSSSLTIKESVANDIILSSG